MEKKSNNQFMGGFHLLGEIPLDKCSLGKQKGGTAMAQDTKKRVWQVIAVFLGLGLFSLFLLFWKPPCLILRFTGLYCPGCGGQRMVFSLLHGDFPAALQRNPCLFFFLPLLLLYSIIEAVRYVRGKGPLYKRKAVQVSGAVIAALALLFMLLRNLPAFAFLAP